MKKQFDIKKLVLLNLPYLLMGLFATNFGEAWRLAQGANASEKFLSLFAVLPGALQSFWPSLHPLDLLVGLCCGAGLRLAVYLKSKNAKKYRHGMEYGSARWGTREDIAPYIDPVFQNNVILTKTESLTMNSRPKDPKTARNKNVLVIGGSGSGKTRFWLKPNLMQMHSSYVVTDPKGTILVECGKMLQTVFNAVPVLLGVLAFQVHSQPQAAAAAQAHQQVQRVQAGPPAGQRHRQHGEEREHFCRSVRTHGHPPRFTEVGGEKPHQDIRQVQQNELFAAAFTEYTGKKVRKAEKSERPSVLAKLSQFKELVKHAVVDRNKRKELER